MRFASLITATSLIAACSSRPTEGSPGAPQVNGDATAASTVVATRWVLVELRGTSISAGETAREPYITLVADGERRFTGSTGCNSMFGSYALSADAVKFGDIGATKMACDRGMGIESSFLTALGQVTRWRIDRQHLELRDAAGTVLARLEARAAK